MADCSPAEPLHIDYLEEALSPLAYRLLKEKQIAGAAIVVVRAGAPQAEIAAAAACAARSTAGGGGGVGGGGSMGSDAAAAAAAAELRGRLEPLVWCRGYGMGRVEDSTVVDVRSTPFDCGSCARILTALAAMQLWQEETIELDVDVNEYLPPGLAVDDTCATPVTLARLLTHTSGFTEADAAADRSQTSSPGVEVRRSLEHRNASPTKSDRNASPTKSEASSTENMDSGVWGAAAVNSSSLTRHLRSNPLTRTSPTGTLYCDCEHNYLLIGSLIEHTSKLPFQRYMAARVLAPLGLTTLGTLPAPGAPESADFLKHRRPTAYTSTHMHGRLVRLPLPPLPYPIPLSPVTGLVATPEEMSRLLLACLQSIEAAERNGEAGGGGSLLTADALAELFATHFRCAGTELAFGFRRRELWEDGPPLLYHSADEVPGADCLLCLFPEHRLALWVGCNTTMEENDELEEGDDSGGGLGDKKAGGASAETEGRFCEAILEAFTDRFFPLHGGRAAAERSPWFHTLMPERPDPLLDLFVFPCVGGSAVVMYESWAALLPDFIQVRAVQLPGRGSRVKETPVSDLMELAEAVATAMLPLLGVQPFAFFGHGLGAMLAYEVARFVQRRARLAPLHLFLSGQTDPTHHEDSGGGSHNWAAAFEAALPPTPGSPAQRNKSMRPKLHSLPDVELAGVLACSTRLSRQFRNKTLMLRAMIGTMRADVRAEESYRHVAVPMDPLAITEAEAAQRLRACGGGEGVEVLSGATDGKIVRCPVTLYVGNRDEHTADAGLQGWAAFTRGPCALQRLPGDHFYLEEPRSREALLRSLGQTLVHHLTRHPSWLTMRGSTRLAT